MLPTPHVGLRDTSELRETSVHADGIVYCPDQIDTERSLRLVILTPQLRISERAFTCTQLKIPAIKAKPESSDL
jgi:hypothetical protein